MDGNNFYGNKRSAEMNSSGLHTRKAQKIGNLTASIDSKLSNVAKLREQFVKEIEDIEIEMKETIQHYKLKISESKCEADQNTEKLKQVNQILSQQSEQIYTKEQENKILGQKLQELYEYQKIIFEALDDISNTLSVHEKLSIKLANYYDTTFITLQNDERNLEEKLNQLGPDKKYSKQLEDLDKKNYQTEQQILQYQKEINNLQMEVENVKRKEQTRNQHLKELDEKIVQLETKKKKLQIDNNELSSQLINDNMKFKEECDQGAIKITKLEENIFDMNGKLETISKQESETEMSLKKKNEEIEKLKKEDKDLDKSLSLMQQDNSLALIKMKESLKSHQIELSSLKNKEDQKKNIIQSKINDYRDKLKNYEGIQQKLKKVEVEKKNEEETINKLMKELENKKKICNTKLLKMNESTNEIIKKIKKEEQSILDSDSVIKQLEEEIDDLNNKMEAKIKISKENAERHSLVDKFKHYENMFSAKPVKDQEKLKSKQKLYTPTLADDDLDIDKLSIDEQFTQLTQSTASQSGSSNKARKFFKSSNSSQSNAKKENSSGRGRGKKPGSTN